VDDVSKAVRFIPLGGLGEVGMNTFALEQRGEVMVVDCGVTFDGRGLGVDVVHPDFSALEAYRDRIRGVVITHGHEDHIGALPYFLRRFDVPVWGPPYALGLVRERLGEHEVLAHARLIETRPREPFAVGSFRVEPIRVTHSIADATALAIETDAGTIVHTGDFKFDEDPPDGETFDVERLAELGDAGVSLLLSDSTNIDARSEPGSESGVGEVLEELVASAAGVVVVAMFASNVHRLRMLGDIAKRAGRKIVPLGRGVSTHSRVARATGYLDWPSDRVWPVDRARELPRSAILGIATGSQAEARAALARLARGEFPALQLGEGDTVILSSRVIPGNEPGVFALMGDLLRRGVEVRSWISDRGVHVSGHAHRSEQKRMIELVRPKAFVPVHGTLHHLMRHAELARELGVENVCVLENGDVGELEAGAMHKRARVASGRVHVFGGRAIAPPVLRERQILAEGGVAFVIVNVDARGRMRGDVAITTRGVVDEAIDGALVEAARRDVRDAVNDLPRLLGDRPIEDAQIAETARLAARRSLARVLGFKPTAVVHVAREKAST
jgi:ribonuclease J